MRWGDDLVLDKEATLRRGLLQLGMYAQHLGTGNTVLCRCIKVATIKLYILAAATFLALFGDHPRDYRKTNPADTTLSPVLTSVFTELQRWESVPNRREPYTLEMLKDMQRRTAAADCGPDSMMSAMGDWFQCGLFAGFRLSEWAQDAGHHGLTAYKRDCFRNAKALTLGDIRFADARGRWYSAVEALQAAQPLDLKKCWIKFRTQKNGENGEEKLFKIHPSGGDCFVSAMWRILKRFERLRGLSDFTTPLAMYQDLRGGATKLITETEINRVMRESAGRVYGLHPIRDKAALQKWSSHSLRVGACVIIHSFGFSESCIKFMLRWRSNAFMVYLRNTAILADMQVRVMDRAAAMPHFL